MYQPVRRCWYWERLCMSEGRWELFVISAQCCCYPETALKNEVYFQKGTFPLSVSTEKAQEKKIITLALMSIPCAETVVANVSPQ